MTDDSAEVTKPDATEEDADSQGIAQKAISGVFWSAVQNWGSQAGSLIAFLVLARLLQPEDFGLVALANTFIVFFTLAIDQGFSTALVQRQQLDEAHWNTAFWVQLGLGVGLTLLILGSAGFVAGIFHQPMLEPVLRSLSLIFLLRPLILVQRAALRRQLAFKKIAIRALVSIFFGGGVGIGLAITGHGVWSLVAQQLTFEAVGVVVFWWVSDWRPALQFSRRCLGDLSSFGVSIFGSNLLAFGNNHFDTLLIGYFLGEVALGYYAIAYRVLQVLTQLLIGTGNQVALPILSRFQSEPERFLKAFYQIVGCVSLVALPIFVGVATLAPELVGVVFGVQWMLAVPMMQVLAFSGMFYIVLFFNMSAFVAMGRPIIRLRLEFINVILNTMGCLIAVRWGVLAVAYAYAISDFLVIPMSLWSLNKLLKISFRDYVKPFASSIAFTVVTAAFVGILRYQLSNWLAPAAVMVICGLTGIALYMGCFRQFLPAEFEGIVDWLKLRLAGRKAGIE